MSTWGEQNFDNDFASDFLWDILLQLLDSINTCLYSIEETEIYQCGEANLMPACDLLLTLGKAYPNIVAPFLEDKPINEWRDSYLKIFDKELEQTDDLHYKTKRRNVIVNTFSELIALL